MAEKEILTYEKYGYYITMLTNLIKKSPIIDVKFIYTFMRGGLPIAVHLSHHLKKPVYTDEKGLDLTIYKSGEILVVDDIADTGKTLEGYQILFPTATLYYKPWSTVKPTFYIKKTKKWIVYPWERINETPNR